MIIVVINLNYIILKQCLPLVQETKGSPRYPEGQVHTGLSLPDLSFPGWQVAPEPQGLGVHKSFLVNSLQETNGSPVKPRGQEQMGLWFLTSQLAPEPHTFGSGSRQGSLHLNLTQALKLNKLIP